MTNPVLVLDIGNTATSVALADTATLACSHRRTIPTPDLRTRLADAIDTMVRTCMHGATPPGAVISSVVAPARDTVAPILASRGITRIDWMRWHSGLGMRVDYPDPATLGTDRLANALYCARIHPGRTVAIIDAGTAIKVDLVKNGNRFAGGTIFPGIATQFNALHAATSLLPRLDTDAPAAPPPGGSTGECIRAGVMFGIAGGVEKIIGIYRLTAGDDPPILATGGAWPLLAPLVNLDVRHVPDLTLAGIAVYALSPAP